MKIIDHAPDVIVSGKKYERVYVVELEPGDVTLAYGVVTEVERYSDNRTKVKATDDRGHTLSWFFSNPMTTTLVEM